jgi:hypothetical protein
MATPESKIPNSEYQGLRPASLLLTHGGVASSTAHRLIGRRSKPLRLICLIATGLLGFAPARLAHDLDVIYPIEDEFQPGLPADPFELSAFSFELQPLWVEF